MAVSSLTVSSASSRRRRILSRVSSPAASSPASSAGEASAVAEYPDRSLDTYLDSDVRQARLERRKGPVAMPFRRGQPRCCEPSRSLRRLERIGAIMPQRGGGSEADGELSPVGKGRQISFVDFLHLIDREG